MKRIWLWLLSTLSAVVLLFGYHTSTSATMAAAPTSSAVSAGTAGATASSTTRPAGTSSGSGSGSFTRTVTGAVESTQWGPVQVQLKMSGDDITAVTVLQQPSGNPRDSEINDYALPILVRETTEADSAHIDMVSGATVTSTGYLQSLQSALDKA